MDMTSDYYMKWTWQGQWGSFLRTHRHQRGGVRNWWWRKL